MRTPISTNDTTVIFLLNDIIKKEFKMSAKDVEILRQEILDINKRLSKLEGKFFIVSGILGVIGMAMLNYLSDILKLLQNAGG